MLELLKHNFSQNLQAKGQQDDPIKRGLVNDIESKALILVSEMS